MRLEELREVFPGSYCTQLSDGTLIPWSPLSIGDYIHYDRLLHSGTRLPCIIENEIFKKCVLSSYYVTNIDNLLAGTVSTVARCILTNSCPSSVEEIDYHLNLSRQKVSNVINDFVCTICLAFPSYKPEDIYAMPYDILIDRLALAEKKQLSIGIMKEPIRLEQKEKEGAAPRKVETEPPKQNLANMFSQQENQTIIDRSHMPERDLVSTGESKDDKMIRDAQFLKETLPIYQDYIEQMKSGEKIKIKSVEERKTEAREREQENKANYIQMMANQKDIDKKIENKLSKERVIRRTVKKHR